MPNLFERAQVIRMKGEPWQNAVQRAKFQLSYENQLGGAKKKGAPRKPVCEYHEAGESHTHKRGKHKGETKTSKRHSCRATTKKGSKHSAECNHYEAGKRCTLKDSASHRRHARHIADDGVVTGADCVYHRGAKGHRCRVGTPHGKHERDVAERNCEARPRKAYTDKKGRRVEATFTCGRKTGAKASAAAKARAAKNPWLQALAKIGGIAAYKELSKSDRDEFRNNYRKEHPAKKAAPKAPKAPKAAAKHERANIAGTHFEAGEEKGYGQKIKGRRPDGAEGLRALGYGGGYSPTSSTRSSDFTSVSDSTSYTQSYRGQRGGGFYSPSSMSTDSSYTLSYA